MTQAAKLKSVIRARAAKTGESYTAARRHVLASRPAAIVRKPSPVPEAPQPEALITQPAREPLIPRGEVSNAAALKRTGHGLDYWFAVLDRFGTGHGHTKTAEYLYSKHKLPGWYAQSITVTWERARGLRQENQTCSGDFQVSVSRSIAAPVEVLVDLINEPKTRAKWLAGVDKALRKGMEEAFAAGKALELKKQGQARMRYKWLSSVVELRLTGNPNGKSTLVADNSALTDAEAVAARREIFARALDRLRAMAGPAVRPASAS
jgi:uncharacterized protein YndB with AHSA1/START domain